MAKKLQITGDLTEGYHMLAIVSNLPDYRLSYFINEQWKTGLKKFADFKPGPSIKGFSWYYFPDEDHEITYYLISNKNQGILLNKELKQFDYIILIKGNFAVYFYRDMVLQLRQIPQIIGVFQQDMKKLKNMDFFLETIEIHELNEVIIPSKSSKYPVKKF